MKIIISTKNLELTKDFEDFVNEKIGGLKKFTGFLNKENTSKKGKDPLEFFVEVKKETEHHKKGQIFLVKTKVNLPGKTFIASSNSDDLSRAVVEVKDELQQELKKYKFKRMELTIRKERKNRNYGNI